jgi:hypothetical protein
MAKSFRRSNLTEHVRLRPRNEKKLADGEAGVRELSIAETAITSLR